MNQKQELSDVHAQETVGEVGDSKGPERTALTKPPLVVNLHKGMKASDYRGADRLTRHLQWDGKDQEDLKAAAVKAAKDAEVSGDGTGTLWPKVLNAMFEEMEKNRRPRRPYEHFNQFVSSALRKKGSIWTTKKKVLKDPSDPSGDGDLNLNETMKSLGRQAACLDPEKDAMSFTYGPFSSKKIEPKEVFRTLHEDLRCKGRTVPVRRTRAWCWELWTRWDHGEDGLTPYLRKGEKWDLNVWDDVWWNRVRESLEYAEGVGLQVDLVLFDWAGLSVKRHDHWSRHVWNPKNHIASLGKIPGAVKGHIPFFDLDYCPEVWLDHQKEFVTKILETIKGLNHVALELSNEPRWASAGVQKWHEKVAGWCGHSALISKREGEEK